MKTFAYLALILQTSAYAGRTEVCPAIAPVMISPKIDVKVDYDKNTKIFTYNYKITNLADAKASIWRFSLENLSPPISVKSEKGWEAAGFSLKDKEIKWFDMHLPDRMDYKIKPNQTRDGFEVISKVAPGSVKIYLDGWSPDLPTIKFDTDEEARKGDHETIACPGFFFGGGQAIQVMSITTGPAVQNRLEAKIRLKKLKEKKWSGSHNEMPDLEISPLDNEKIQLMIFGDKDIDVSKINLATLEFGRGKAKPTKTAIIGEFKGAADAEITEHVKKNENSHLLLEFNLQDVDVKCDIDRALFLTGKIGTQDLFGAAKIKHVGCSKETFSKEAKKIRESEDSH